MKISIATDLIVFGGHKPSYIGFRNNASNDEVWSFDFQNRKWSFLTLRLKYVRGKCFFFITLLKR